MLLYISVILFWGLSVTLLSNQISLYIVQVRTAQKTIAQYSKSTCPVQNKIAAHSLGTPASSSP